LISDLTVTEESFDSLALLQSDPKSSLDWNLVFTLPAWLKVWWQNFGAGADLYLRAVRQNGQILGIAPLQIRKGTASIVGSVNVCDYQDLIIAPGRERDFYQAVLDDLLKRKITRLHLETIRPDSSIVKHLMPLAQERRYKIDYRQADVSSDMQLPAGWDDYLIILDSKQRHELKRKIRNLNEAVVTKFRTISDKASLLPATNEFLKLFPESREDKAEFMTAEIQNYFVSLAAALAGTGILHYGSLELDGQPIAMVMYFEYRDNYYLYNSAYDPAYRSLSVGIISKALCIKDGIEKGKKRFDFLKGQEVYKSHLGGHEIPLYSCEISLE
jgi:CelD/BcsL family acetyltransferase involved in cellulose biosynthesis